MSKAAQRRPKKERRQRRAAPPPSQGAQPGADPTADRAGRGRGLPPRELAAVVAVEAVTALCEGERAGFDSRLARLADTDPPGWTGAVSGGLVDLLQVSVANAWRLGWQPAELARHIDRELTATHASMLSDMITDEMRDYPASAVDDRWAAQVAALPVTSAVSGGSTASGGATSGSTVSGGAGSGGAASGRSGSGSTGSGSTGSGGAPWWGSDADYLTAWRAEAGERTSLGGLLGTVATAIEGLHQLQHLAALDPLLPLPGTPAARASAASSSSARSSSGTRSSSSSARSSSSGSRETGSGSASAGPSGSGPAGSASAASASAGPADDRVLGRIRALLAKAESTEFAEEAEALSARAQALMAKYSIDHALLAARQGAEETPGGCRIAVDNPYESPKVQLLNEVAKANRCRTVWLRELGLVTVIGFRADLDAVELLFTSLLVQANTAMMRAGAKRDSRGRSRTRAFRQSFLISYAYRIGERLSHAAEHAVEEATDEQAAARSADDRGDSGAGRPGTDLVPLLAARDAAIDDTVEEMFGASLTVTRAVRATDLEGWNSGRAAADLASLHNRDQVTN
jgi:hypothetical protein